MYDVINFVELASSVGFAELALWASVLSTRLPECNGGQEAKDLNICNIDASLRLPACR